MKDEELKNVRGIRVEVRCSHCGSTGRVKSKKNDYELISCPVCYGAGTTPATVDARQLAEILELWLR